MLLNKDKASSSLHTEYTKSDYCLCLAIHAPRKGIIEVFLRLPHMIFLQHGSPQEEKNICSSVNGIMDVDVIIDRNL